MSGVDQGRLRMSGECKCREPASIDEIGNPGRIGCAAIGVLVWVSLRLHGFPILDFRSEI